jgi:hypothetical protein
MTKRLQPILEVKPGERYLSNLDTPGREVSIVFVVGALLTLGAAFGAHMVNHGYYSAAAIRPQMLALAALLGLWLLRKRFGDAPRNWLSPDVVFVAPFCVFHFAYLAYYVLGWAPPEREVFFSPTLLEAASFLSVACLGVFLIGYECAGGLFRRANHAPRIENIDATVLSISKTLLLVSVVFMVGVMLHVGIGRLMTNYRLMTEIGYTAFGRFFWVAQNLGAVAMAMYCAASGLLYRKAMHGLVFPAIAIGFALLILLCGDRGGFIYLMIVPITAFYYFQYKIKIRWVLAGFAGLLFLMGVVSATRGAITLNVAQIAEEYKHVARKEEQNALTRTLLEFGVSIKTVVIAMAVVPDEADYWYGRSYLDSLEVAVPNVIPGMVRTGEQGLGTWLNEGVFGSSQRTWGRGGSIAMEAYVNFGFIGGILFFGLLGAVYRTLYERFLARPSFLRAVLLFALFSATMLWVRNTSYLVARTMLWALLTAWTLQQLYAQQPTAGQAPANADAGGMRERLSVTNEVV